MRDFQVKAIGKVNINEKGMFIELEQEYIPALKALDGFGHLNVIWWFSDYDSLDMRKILEAPKPYKKGPDVLGIFATRAPVRPNPVALSTARVISINYEKGIIQVAYIDANDGTPVLDIKPYTPSLDRVETPGVPAWCKHWPVSIEQSESFNWENEFNF